jgi:hypothetical protein
MKTYETAVLAFAAGYICGCAVIAKKHSDWQKNHQFQCWKARNVERPGDYPQVFVIDKREERRDG